VTTTGLSNRRDGPEVGLSSANDVRSIYGGHEERMPENTSLTIAVQWVELIAVERTRFGDTTPLTVGAGRMQCADS
jgi:hypothetical protein